jgi:CDP-diacylglycerol---glycerol-3-phosphate 3-phosphatidyltransferase
MIYPNQLTVLRIILTPVFVFLFLADDPLLKQISVVVYIIAAITDWYDGWLARKFNYITEWGKFLDPLADKVLTSGAFLAFVVLGVLDLWMVLIIILRDFLITGLRIYADYKKRNFSTSVLAQWKTFIQMAFIYYLLLFYTLRTVEPINQKYGAFLNAVLDKQIIYWSMLFVTLFTLITGIMYLFTNRKLIRQLIKFEN